MRRTPAGPGDSYDVNVGGAMVGSAIGRGNKVAGIAVGGAAGDATAVLRQRIEEFRATVASLPAYVPAHDDLLEATGELAEAAAAPHPDRVRVEEILGRVAAWAVPLGLLADVTQIADLARALF